jgi:hypothetical protein
MNATTLWHSNKNQWQGASLWRLDMEGDTNTERRAIPCGWKYNNIDCMYGETFTAATRHKQHGCEHKIWSTRKGGVKAHFIFVLNSSVFSPLCLDILHEEIRLILIFSYINKLFFISAVNLTMWIDDYYISTCISYPGRYNESNSKHILCIRSDIVYSYKLIFFLF